MKCSDYAIVPIIKVLRAIFTMIEVIAPILAIVAGTILLLRMMTNPDDKKLINNMKNMILSLVIVFLLPALTNLTMYILGENFSVSSCWNNAYKINTSGNGGYIEKEGKNKIKIIEEKTYDKGATEKQKTDSSSTEETEETSSSLTVEGSTSQEKWLNALTEVGKYMVDKKFVYSNNDVKRTLEKATKTNKRTNCANYISMAMQEVGLLPKGKTIWLDSTIHGNGASYIKKSTKVTITYPNKKVKNMDLQPGDIVGFDLKNGQHTTVYAGTDSKGNRLWYSGGSKDVSEHNYGPKKKSYEDREVKVLIRPNYNAM